MSNFLEQPDLGIGDYEYMQLLQIGQKLTRSKIVKYSKDTKGHDAPNSPSSKTLKKNKAIKGLTKTKTTKKEEKGKEDERLGDVLQKKVKKVPTPTPSPLKRTQSNPVQTTTTPKVLVPPKLKKKMSIPEEIEVIKEPPKAKLPGVILEAPVYSFPFFPQYTNRYNIKNEIALGFNELTGRNIKVLQKGEENDQIQLLNAVITKKAKNEDKLYIEFVDQKPQKYHHLKKKLKKIEELTHREFFLCQEVGVVELNAELLLKLLGTTASELKYWPILVLNNASKEFASEQLVEPKELKISDDFACLDEESDIGKAAKELYKEGINVQLKKKTQIKAEESPSTSSPIMVEDDNFSREISSIFRLDDEVEEEKIPSVHFSPTSNVDLDSFSDFGSSPLKKELSQRIEEENELLEEEKNTGKRVNAESEAEGKKEEIAEEKIELGSNEPKEEEKEAPLKKEVESQKGPKESVTGENEMVVEEKKEVKEAIKTEADTKGENEVQIEKEVENQVLVWFIGTNVFKM